MCMAMIESLLTLEMAGGGRTAMPAGVDDMYILYWWVGEGMSDSD